MSSVVSLSNLHVLDYVLFAAFIAISLGIGIFYGCFGDRQRTNSEFLMGNRNLSTIPVALSILVSFFSATTTLGMPVEVYFYGAQFNLTSVGFAIACAISTVTFVPLFFELQVTSAYEYLEVRYRSKSVRLIGTIIALGNMLVQMGIVIYAPAVALQAVSGIPVWVSITVSSVVATFYTTLGGLKAVIYTDVFQAFCMMAGTIAIIVQGSIEVGSGRKIWELNKAYGRLEFFDFNPDPTVRLTFWSVMLGSICRSLFVFGTGQSTVQRFCALPTLAKAKRSMWLNTVSVLICILLAGSVGFVIFAYYADRQCDPLRGKYIANQNQLVSYFVRTVLNYPGITGAFFAVLFGGSLSTMSSTYNSAAAITWEDLLKDSFQHFTEFQKAIVSKILVLAYGIIGAGLAFAAEHMSSHVLEGSVVFLGVFGGPLLGIFILGAFFPFANNIGALVGCSMGVLLNLWITIGSFIYKRIPETLPTSIEKCNATFDNATFALDRYSTDSSDIGGYSDSVWGIQTTGPTNYSEIEDWNELSNPLIYLYSISFNLIPIVGLVVTLIFGAVFSLLTGGRNQPKLDPRLLIPIGDHLCCCLPRSWRRRFRCGRKHEDTANDANDMEERINLEPTKEAENVENDTRSVNDRERTRKEFL